MLTGVAYVWNRSGNVATFDVDNVTFEIAFKHRSINHHLYGGISGFQVSFYKQNDKDSPWMYKATGEGNASTILGTVVNVVRNFLVNKKPMYVWFVADESSRVRLYNKIINRMCVDGYVAEITDTGMYMLRRIKSVFETLVRELIKEILIIRREQRTTDSTSGEKGQGVHDAE